MRTIRWVGLAAVLAVVVPSAARATVVPSEPGAEAVSPADAEAVTTVPVMFYSSGNGAAESGLLVNGAYQRKKTYTFETGWKFAISKTSALWHKPGTIAYGTMTGGIYTQKGFTSLTATVDLMAASCDTVALYSGNTGELRTATLNNGVPGPWTVTSTGRLMTRMEATCDSLIFYRNDEGYSRFIVGTLKAGKFSLKQEFDQPPFERMGTTSTSIVMLSSGVPSVRSALGRVAGGSVTPTRFLTVSNVFTRVVGGGNTVILYDGSTGSGRSARLVNGVWTDVGPVTIQTPGDVADAGK